MKTAAVLLPFLVVLSVVSCEDRKIEGGEDSISNVDAGSRKKQQQLYDEVWMMRGWQGHMCVVLAITGDRCEQWFLSDSGFSSDMNEFHECEVRNTDDGFSLITEDVSGLYASEWNYVVEGGVTFLASVDDIDAGRDKGRWLRKVHPVVFVKYLKDEGPFVLHMNSHLENE